MVAISVTATKLSASSFTIDGEAVVCGPDGIAIFDALHRHGTVSDAMLYAFHLLELDGKDLRDRPLADRKKLLARLVGKRRIGIVLSEHTDGDLVKSLRKPERRSLVHPSGIEGLILGSWGYAIR
jgi:ATP-dependent DNA ligase